MDRFSHEPDLPFTSRALSVPTLDYLDVSRSRYARYHKYIVCIVSLLTTKSQDHPTMTIPMTTTAQDPTIMTTMTTYQATIPRMNHPTMNPA